ncbi:MAG: SDR family oxidoreductase [Halobacterium sp.]
MTTTVAVTGAASGLGEAVARSFAEDGATVAVGDRDRDAIEALAADVGGVAVWTDVRDEYEVERLLEEASRAGDASGVDVVVPCASVFHGDAGESPLEEASYSAFDDTVRTNARGAFAAVREAVPHMDDSSRVVIPTASVARDAQPGYGTYAVSKAAVEGVMRQFSADLEQAVGCVEVGTVDTGFEVAEGRDAAAAADLVAWAASVPGELDGAVLDADDRQQPD